MTPSEIEPATFRLVDSVKQLHYRMSSVTMEGWIIMITIVISSAVMLLAELVVSVQMFLCIVIIFVRV
jgi:hypothetical protein